MKVTELFESKDTLSPDLIDALNAKANGADNVEYKGKKYKREGPKNASSQPGKWVELFNYREWAGVKIRKVQFSSGIGGPKRAKEHPEERVGNFYGIAKEQSTTIKKLRDEGWYMHNGWETFGKEWVDDKDKEGKHFERSIQIMVKTGEKGATAILPSGKTKKVPSKTWKPELSDFKA